MLLPHFPRFCYNYTHGTHPDFHIWIIFIPVKLHCITIACTFFLVCLFTFLLKILVCLLQGKPYEMLETMELLRQNVATLVNDCLCGLGNGESNGAPVENNTNFPLRKGYLCEQKQSSVKAFSQGQHQRRPQEISIHNHSKETWFVDSHVIKATSVDFL